MMMMAGESVQENHGKAVRFFWGLLATATLVSVGGNVVHAVLPFIPPIAVQVAVAAVPPLVLLLAVHGIALAVRAGASGVVYRCAVGAVAAIGVGAFSVSFMALRDLMQAIGYSANIAWVFPAIVDTAVAVSTLMLVALGDKPARRSRSVHNRQHADAQGVERNPLSSIGAKAVVSAHSATAPKELKNDVRRESDLSADTDIAQALIASRVTTQPTETVLAVLSARRDGLSINASAKAAGINYRTAQRIVEAASTHLAVTLEAAR